MTTIRAPVSIAMPVSVKRRRLACRRWNSGVPARCAQSWVSAAGRPLAAPGGGAFAGRLAGVDADMALSSLRGWSSLQRFGREPAQLRALHLAAVGGVGGGQLAELEDPAGDLEGGEARAAALERGGLVERGPGRDGEGDR